MAALLTLASGGVIAVQGYSSLGDRYRGVDRVPVGVFERPRGRAGDRGYRAGGHHQPEPPRSWVPCGFEEIDAVECMAVHSVSYLRQLG